jgi:hypothetical protein
MHDKKKKEGKGGRRKGTKDRQKETETVQQHYIR